MIGESGVISNIKATNALANSAANSARHRSLARRRWRDGGRHLRQHIQPSATSRAYRGASRQADLASLSRVAALASQRTPGIGSVTTWRTRAWRAISGARSRRESVQRRKRNGGVTA
jgi:hypothetical protein